MTEREFWLLIRRALLIICRAIEQRYLTTEVAADCNNLPP